MVFNYIINILEKLPRPDINNNYEKYLKMNNEIKVQRIKVNSNFQFDTVYDLLGQEVAKKYQEVLSQELLIEIQPKCLHTKYENRNSNMTQVERAKLKSYKERSHADTQMEFNKLMENYILQIVDDIFSKILKLNRIEKILVIKQKLMRF